MKTLRQLVQHIRRDKRGNVLMITGLSIIPLVSATGMGVDYARAARLQTKLNAAADAAALAAVSQPMMAKTVAEATQLARDVFLQQVSSRPDVVFNPSNLVVTVASTGATSNRRTSNVTYTARSKNAFGGILGLDSIEIAGGAASSGERAPNIDFYLVLDTSPSMALPATTGGIATMTAKTGGCAFACHQTNVSGADTVVQGGVRMSYYSYARTQGVVLRTDLVQTAVEDLTDVATATSATNNAAYRMALANFDYRYNSIVATPGPVANVKLRAADAQLLPYCLNSQRICGTNDNDTATNFTAAFDGILAATPTNPGEGTNNAGDTPQAMVFLITDGMRDENSGGTRRMGPMPTAQCTALKNRGVRIAILYTEYLPSAASDSWSISNVRTPYLSPTDNISPPLIACASPGLYYKVTTDGDISASLTALFRQAVATAHLVQ